MVILKKKIVRFIEMLILKFVETVQKKAIGTQECLLLVDNMLNEWDFQEIKDLEKAYCGDITNFIPIGEGDNE